MTNRNVQDFGMPTYLDDVEKIELITYEPGKQDTGDLEAATHTIVPTARPAIASAQYNHSLTLPKPDDARLILDRIATRLNVNIAGLGTATHVYCSVRVDVDDTDHELFSEDWTSIGDKLDAVDTHSANKAMLFDLLKDGAAHTFYFLFWADVASQATIDVIQLWEGAGTCATNGVDVLTLSHTGLVHTAGGVNKQGTGSAYLLGSLVSGDQNKARLFTVQGLLGNAAYANPHFLVPGTCYFLVLGTVATDLNYIGYIYLVLRSEQ